MLPGRRACQRINPTMSTIFRGFCASQPVHIRCNTQHRGPAALATCCAVGAHSVTFTLASPTRAPSGPS